MKPLHWKIEGKHNSLREGNTVPSLENAIKTYDHVISIIKNDLKKLPESDYCTIRFEELENTPVPTLHNALSSIGVNLNEEQLRHLNGFAGSLKNYKKNDYNLSKEQIEYIQSKLHHHFNITSSS